MFQKVVTVRKNLDGALNGYNVAELEGNALSKSKSQDITGNILVDVLNVNNADVEIIDGVRTEHLLFQDASAPQAINSSISFSDFAAAGNIDSKLFMDDCDFSMMTKVVVNEIKKLGIVDVMGSVTWNRDRRDRKGISYLYGNAVMRHEEQVLGGSLTFRNQPVFHKLTTKNNINDVDLQFIVQDAVYSSSPVQEILQDITLRGKTTADNIIVENNIIVDNINGIDILELGERLVRNNEDIEIRGTKKFLLGFTTHRFISESVNGAKTGAIIFCDGREINGSITFDATTFHSVKTLKNFDVHLVNGVHLPTLLEERLSRTNSGSVTANLRIKAPVSIKGDEGICRINDLDMKDVISISGELVHRSIMGKVEFNSTFSAAERLELGKLNHRNFTEMRRRVLLNMTDSVIKGNIIFKEDVEFGGNVNALHSLYGCQTKSITSMEVPIKIGYRETSYVAEIEKEIDKIGNSSKSLVKPIILIDLHARATVHLNISRVEKVRAAYEGDSLHLNVYGADKVERCHCYCATQKKLAIPLPIAEVLAAENVFPINYKYFDEHSNTEIIVTASSSRCDDAMDATSEYGMLHWWRREEMRKEEKKGNSTKFIGRLIDVKFFTVPYSVFVVMAFRVRSSENSKKKVNVIVYEFDARTEIMKKIQEMEVWGVEAIDLFWTPKGMVLVVGNALDSELAADSVDSAIYRFSDTDNQFKLLRLVKTHGIRHIASITHGKESFIFLVQRQSWPFLILKYNHEYDNYYFSQKLHADHFKIESYFLSAAAFTTSRPGYDGDIVVGIVQADGGFRLLKYKHIEGFVDVGHLVQRNVELLTVFYADFRQYLLAASSVNHSIIYELVQEGYFG